MPCSRLSCAKRGSRMGRGAPAAGVQPAPRGPLSRRRFLGIIGALALIAGGCLGTLPNDERASATARAAAHSLNLPLREERPHWLLRRQPGWQAAHLVRFGGGDTDPAVATIRTARFSDAAAAAAAFARLTPAYLHQRFRQRMLGEPWPVAYPEPLAGDAVAVLAYRVQLPPFAGDRELIGQLTVVRAGATVLLIESIGVPPEQVVAVLEAVTTAAAYVK